MKDIAAEINQSIPLYLMVIGGVLIVVLIFLLIKMRRRKEEKAPIAPPPEHTGSGKGAEERAERSAPVGTAMEAGEEERAEPAATKEEEVEEAGAVALPVQKRPFPETPNIGRDSFGAFAGRHVLIVEDNPVNRKLILTLLSQSGIELDSAEDGHAALEKLRAPEAAYDLILMDVNMPGMDGLECTREIRQDPRLKNIPVLALTASTTPEEVRKILQSGMSGYLDKPLVLGRLYTALVRFLQKYRVPRAEAEAMTEVQTDRAILDTRVGLEHSNNDAGLYRMLLEDFLQQYKDSPREFRRLIAAKDYDGVHRLVIDLEGISGALGAMELYGLIQRVNRVLERGTTRLLGDEAEAYAEVFERLDREIRHYLGD